MERRVRLNAINPHMLCVLCGGYFIDATTIVECLHTFCRSCIVKHLENNKTCPICDAPLHKNGPLHSIRPDKQMQRLVYKVVEGLHSNEWERRKQFYQSQEVITKKVLVDTVKDLDRVANFKLFKPEDPISLSLEYYDDSAKINAGNDETNLDSSEGVQKRYLQCPAGVLVWHIKKFLIKKYQLSKDHRVDVYYKNALLREHFSLSAVADLYDYDRVKPMRLFFQLLEMQAVTVKNATHVVVAESPPSTSIEAISPPPTNLKTSSDQPGPSSSVALGKKKLRDDSNMESVSKPKRLRLDQRDSGRGLQMGKLRNNPYTPAGCQTPRRILGIQSQDVVEEEVVSKCNSVSESNIVDKASVYEFCPEPTTEPTEDADVMEAENVSQTADSVGDEVNTTEETTRNQEEVVVDVEGESSQDFMLQDEQQMDINEDLEEDDDEDRLRICDPEEVVEDRNGTDSFDETVETEPAQNDGKQLESFIEEEEVEVVKKESKSRKKNKKAKHHHRHKRAYSPAPEATIVSDDKNDIMKLKVKITRPDSDANGSAKSKQDESAKHVKPNDNQRQSKHKSIVISDDADTNSVKSLNNSNIDEDSRNSQSTDDHDERSITSSKEGQDDTLSNTKEPTPNGSLKQLKAKNIQFSNKAKLLQMRQVRHKNLTPPPRNINQTPTIRDSSEEVPRKSAKPPTVLSSPNAQFLRDFTVSKITAEEKLKLMANNNLEKPQPSLEIFAVNKSNLLPKSIENKTSIENHDKHKGLTLDSPSVRLTKTHSMNAVTISKQQSLSVTKIDNNNKSIKSFKDDKSRIRPGERRPESFGVLDLSKPVRSTSCSPASEGSCPSPSQTTLSLTQPIIKRHVSSISSPQRVSSESPPVQGSPNRTMQQFTHSGYNNLSVLSNAAASLRENKTQSAQEAMKRQQLNNQQKVSNPLQRYPGMSPAKAPVSRATPTQLKIPNPNVSLHNKFLNRPKLPNSHTIPLQNSVRPTRPMPPVNPRPNNNFGNMLSQSAAVAKKQAGMNGRNPNIPPPPAGIPISELYKMPQKYDLEKIARGLTAARKAEVKGQARIPSS